MPEIAMLGKLAALRQAMNAPQIGGGVGSGPPGIAGKLNALGGGLGSGPPGNPGRLNALGGGLLGGPPSNPDLLKRMMILQKQQAQANSPSRLGSFSSSDGLSSSSIPAGAPPPAPGGGGAQPFAATASPPVAAPGRTPNPGPQLVNKPTTGELNPPNQTPGALVDKNRTGFEPNPETGTVSAGPGQTFTPKQRRPVKGSGSNKSFDINPITTGKRGEQLARAGEFIEPALDLQKIGEAERALRLRGLGSKGEFALLKGGDILDKQVFKEQNISDINRLRELGQQAAPGIQQFLENRQAGFQGQEAQALAAQQAARGTQGQATNKLQQLLQGGTPASVLQALSLGNQALGSSALGKVSPQTQAFIEQERNAGVARARQAAFNDIDSQLSRLQSLSAGRGLGRSSVAARQQQDLISNRLNQVEGARQQAEQLAAQRGIAAQQLGVQERGQTISGAQGLTAAGLSPQQLQANIAQNLGSLGIQQQGLEQQGLAALNSRINQTGPAAQLAAQLGTIQPGLQAATAFSQQDINNQLQALGLALGTPTGRGDSSAALGTAIGGAAGAILGSVIPGIGTETGAIVGGAGGGAVGNQV